MDCTDKGATGFGNEGWRFFLGSAMGFAAAFVSSGLATTAYALLSVEIYLKVGPLFSFLGLFALSACNYLAANALLGLRWFVLMPTVPMRRGYFVSCGVAVVFLTVSGQFPAFFRLLPFEGFSALFGFGFLAAVLVLVVEFFRNLVARTKSPA